MPLNQTTRKYLIRAAALIAGTLLFVFVINLSWFDEPLRPELARLATPNDVPLDGNAYPILVGLTAAPDRDAAAVGRRVIERLRERYRNGERITLTTAELDELRGGPGLGATDAAWRDGLVPIDCNSRLTLDCATTLLAAVGKMPRLHPDLMVMIGRYETILKAPRFAEIEEGDAYTPIPDYSATMAVSRIRLAQSLARDPTAAFLARAAEDFGFWRGMLLDGQSLIAKMVALAGMRNNLDYLSWLLAHRDLTPAEIATIERIATPLTDAERDIGEVFLSELRLSILSDQDLVVMLGDRTPVVALTLQENATLNEYYLTIVQTLRLRATMDAETFARVRADEPISYELRRFPPPIYNLGGKLVLKRMTSEYGFQDYISRVHDFAGRMELVLLQAEIEANPDRSVESVVRGSTHRNPYTGEGMRYDPAAGTLSFECLANSERDVCAVLL